MKLKEIEIRIKHIRKNKLIIKNATLDSDKEYKKQTNQNSQIPNSNKRK